MPIGPEQSTGRLNDTGWLNDTWRGAFSPADAALKRAAPRYCTLADTEAAPVSVNVQLRCLFPPLEQAPDQIASRPFETLSVIGVPDANDAEPLVPVETLMPVGLDVIRSPLRPLAVTVNVAF